jgi:hypothetical protein
VQNKRLAFAADHFHRDFNFARDLDLFFHGDPSNS